VSQKNAFTTSRGDLVILYITAAVALVGICVLVGWHLHVRALVQIIPGAIPMQYNAALCFLVLSASAGALVSRRVHPGLARVGGALVAFMGALVIFEYVTGTSLGIDTAFFYPWERTLSADPGRMALTTAISFTVAGGTLALLASKPDALAAFVIAHALPLNFGLTSLLGYLLGITYVLPFRLGSQMAVHTALGFMLYSSVMLVYAWRRAPQTQEEMPRWTPGIAAVMVPVLFTGFSSASQSNSVPALIGQLVLAVFGAALLGLSLHKLRQARVAYKGLILIAIPLVFVLAFVALVNQLKRTGERVQDLSSNSKEVIARTHALLSSLIDAQSSMHGYVITGDPADLESYNATTQQIPEEVNRLRTLVHYSTGELEAGIERLEAKAVERISFLTKTRDLVNEGKRDEAVEIIKSDADERLMAAFRREMVTFLAAEGHLDAALQQSVRDSWQRFDSLLVAGASADLLLAMTLAFLFTRGIGRGLQTLTENTQALAEGRELSKPLEGTDEIAHLDRVFHRMAQELRNAHEGLETKVKERTVELSQTNEQLTEQIAERQKAEESLRASEEQLRQSQKLEAVGQLAGGVAHDFNNLLTVIMGYSDLLLRSSKHDDSMRSKTEEIKKAAVRAAALTRQLLAFSRKQVLQPKVLELNSLVTEVSKMLRRLIGEDIEFIMLLRPEAGRISADPGQIEQVLMNLVVNARDAIPQGGKIIIETGNVELHRDSADLHREVEPGDYVLLTVSDSGRGMDEGTRKRIFEPFFTTKEVGKGTGLGLSTVYGIVKQSGGNIFVYSEVGRGTTFKIYFPRVKEEAASQPTAQRAQLPRGSETILLVEDEAMVRKLARTILEENGYEVLEAANGNEAIIREQHAGEIHLMVTDVVMPLMSGRELAERVRERRHGIKVLYMSGYTDDAIVHHGVLEAGTHFLEKPFTPDALAWKVREVLDKA